MNGLDLLSKIKGIDITELKVKEISGDRTHYSKTGQLTLDQLLMMNMDYFKYLTLKDGEWVIVFDYTESYMLDDSQSVTKSKETSDNQIVIEEIKSEEKVSDSKKDVINKLTENEIKTVNTSNPISTNAFNLFM